MIFRISKESRCYLNAPLLLLEDKQHSLDENRFHALGRTDEYRLLHLTFTLRYSGEKIRVISARSMHKKEREIHEKKNLKKYHYLARKRKGFSGSNMIQQSSWTGIKPRKL